MLGDGLGIREVQAVQVNVLVGVVALIDLVEDLPSDVVVDLLFHLLVLFKSYFFIDISLVFARLKFFVGLVLQILSNLFVFVDSLNLSLLLYLRLVKSVIFVGGRAHDRVVLALHVGVVQVLFDDRLSPET